MKILPIPELKKYFLLLPLQLIIVLSLHAQDNPTEPINNPRYSYLKVSPFPLLYPILASGNMRQWIVLQYESQFTQQSKFTYSIVGELRLYRNTYGYNSHAIIVRPEVRYYFGKQTYHGFFAGLFPYYQYENGEFSSQLNGYGLGAIIGYQHFIKNIPIEFVFGTGYGPGTRKIQNGPTVTDYYKRTYSIAVIELNIGLPIKKKQ